MGARGRHHREVFVGILLLKLQLVHLDDYDSPTVLDLLPTRAE